MFKSGEEGGPLMLGPKLRKNSLTKALSKVRSVIQSPVLLEDDGGIPILQLNSWNDIFTQEMEIDGRVNLHSLLDEDQGRLLAVRGYPNDGNNDESGFLMSVFENFFFNYIKCEYFKML